MTHIEPDLETFRSGVVAARRQLKGWFASHTLALIFVAGAFVLGAAVGLAL